MTSKKRELEINIYGVSVFVCLDRLPLTVIQVVVLGGGDQQCDVEAGGRR